MTKKPYYKKKRVLLPAAALVGFVAIGATADPSADEVTVTNASTDSVAELKAQAEADRAEAERLAAETAAAKAAADKAAAAAAADPTVDFAMPDLRGANLQVAQNTVQTHGVLYSISHDLRGMRMQVLDSNWQVCSQTPPPGERISGPAGQWEGKIDFGVVKLEETCP